MDPEWPRVTIIIPTRPGQADIPALTAARKLDYPPAKLEILIARGKQPAIQRNAAIREASGEIIYFLDDDAVASPDNLRRAIGHFRDPKTAIVGGPNLCPKEAPRLEKIFAVALASWIGFGPSRARYDQVGGVRPSSEKELILCNMLGRKEPLLQLGGFDESLYPNEENALMDGLQKAGSTLLYDPELVVYRRPRPSVKAFAKMLLNYGRGRAEQFRLHPTFGSALNFVPPLFCLYLVIAPFFGAKALLPLAAYALAILGQTVASIPRKGFVLSLAATPLFVMTHILYGLGFWRGLLLPIKHREAAATTDVQLERIAL